MAYLFTVSMIWAFSFGLIKENLTAIDSNFVACARMVISFLVFLPFLRIKKTNPGLASRLVIIGMFQYGLMYIAYIYSYRFLKAYEVALFTIFTPIYVTLINDLLRRRFHLIYLVTATLAVAGTAILKYQELGRTGLVEGFLLLQAANICFAFGQVAYKKVMEPFPHVKNLEIFGLLYLGASMITAAFALNTMEWGSFYLGGGQVLTLIYLGAVASGLCFFLWNIGARKTNAGTLAVFNNLKIPLAVAVSLVFFREEGPITRLLLGGAVVAAALVFNEFMERKKQGRRS